MSNYRNLQNAISGVSVKKKKKVVRSYRDNKQTENTSDDDITVLPSSKETPPPFDPDVPDTSKGDFYCRVCDAHNTTEVIWANHITGKRHIKNRSKKPNEPPSKVKTVKLDVEAKLYEHLKDVTEPIIGLDCVSELQRPNFAEQYTCFSCGATQTTQPFIEHILSTKHRITYIKKVDEPGYNVISNMRMKGEALDSIVEEHARVLEAKEGRGKIEVKMEKPKGLINMHHTWRRKPEPPPRNRSPLSPPPLRRSPFNSRRSPLSSRRSPPSSRRSPLSLRRSPPLSSRRSPLPSRRSPYLSRRSPHSPRRSPYLSRRSPHSPRRSPHSPRRRSPSPVRRSSYSPRRSLSPRRSPLPKKRPHRSPSPSRVRRSPSPVAVKKAYYENHYQTNVSVSSPVPAQVQLNKHPEFVQPNQTSDPVSSPIPLQLQLHKRPGFLHVNQPSVPVSNSSPTQLQLNKPPEFAQGKSEGKEVQSARGLIENFFSGNELGELVASISTSQSEESKCKTSFVPISEVLKQIPIWSQNERFVVMQALMRAFVSAGNDVNDIIKNTKFLCDLLMMLKLNCSHHELKSQAQKYLSEGDRAVPSTSFNANQDNQRPNIYDKPLQSKNTVPAATSEVDERYSSRQYTNESSFASQSQNVASGYVSSSNSLSERRDLRQNNECTPVNSRENFRVLGEMMSSYGINSTVADTMPTSRDHNRTVILNDCPSYTSTTASNDSPVRPNASVWDRIGTNPPVARNSYNVHEPYNQSNNASIPGIMDGGHEIENQYICTEQSMGASHLNPNEYRTVSQNLPQRGEWRPVYNNNDYSSFGY